MKYYTWNDEKNRKLQKERNVCFEDILFHLERNDLVGRIKHPNQEKYPNQEIYLVNIDGYIYMVPFVESEEEIFMKTIIPSRKATKKYLKERGDEE